MIGDTPADITCGKTISARTIAVATGSCAADERAAHEPWLVVPRIPEPRHLRSVLRI